MTPMHPENTTRILGKDQPEYQPLPIVDEEIEGVNHMTSAWQPSEEERKLLVEGGPIHLTVLGNAHPPVMLFVGTPE